MNDYKSKISSQQSRVVAFTLQTTYTIEDGRIQYKGIDITLGQGIDITLGHQYLILTVNH